MRSVEECYRGSGVRVFRLDGEKVVSRLAERSRALLHERPDVLEVRLFGSLARDEAGPRSDADLLVILQEPAPPFLDRAALLSRYWSGVGVACDVFAYTASELEQLRRTGSGLIHAANAEGVVLARRRGSTRGH